jgi:hypothetical protein
MWDTFFCRLFHCRDFTAENAETAEDFGRKEGKKYGLLQITENYRFSHLLRFFNASAAVNSIYFYLLKLRMNDLQWNQNRARGENSAGIVILPIRTWF